MTRPQIKAAGESSGQPAPLVAPASGDLTTGDQKPATAAFTAGPWSVCGADRGVCQCVTILSKHHPIATAVSGAWGDNYPSLRFVEDSGEGSIGAKIEAYMEQITYGEVPEAVAKANARLIAAAPDMYEALKLAEEIIEQQRIWSPDECNQIACALAKAEGKQ